MSSNGEIIHVHVGQAGVQIANACWELYCLEHGIDQYGCLYDYTMNNSFQTFFAYSSTSKLVPRLVMVDSEPTVIDEVRTGTYGALFKPQTLISGKEDSGSNFARGYNTLGTELIDLTMDSLRDVAESCPNLKGFLVFRSIGGGTGSGLGNRIMEEISNDYGKMSKMDFIIFPSPSITPLIVEPYNSLLATHIGMDSSDCTFILDNEALYDICETKLGVYSPSYTNLNRIIAQAISTLTASQRFFGSLNVSFTEFQTNLVPFPRIHFPLVSYSPLIAMDNACYTQLATEHMTFDCFHPSSQFIRCNPVKGKYMSCVLLYRGNVASSDINSSIRIMKSRGCLNFVDWSPTGFKVGINSMPPCAVYGGDIGPTDRAMMALTNNTAIQLAWCRMLNKYMQLYNRRAFLHHFMSEGLEESTFLEASEDICSLISDYREVEDLSGTDACSSGRGRTNHLTDEGPSWKQRFKTYDDNIQVEKVHCEENHGKHLQNVIKEDGSITKILHLQKTYKSTSEDLSKSCSHINTFAVSQEAGRIHLNLNLCKDGLPSSVFSEKTFIEGILIETIRNKSKFRIFFYFKTHHELIQLQIQDDVCLVLQGLLESLKNEKSFCNHIEANEKQIVESSKFKLLSKRNSQNSLDASDNDSKPVKLDKTSSIASGQSDLILNKSCKSSRSYIPRLIHKPRYSKNQNAELEH